jgi:hypothetical protein
MFASRFFLKKAALFLPIFKLFLLHLSRKKYVYRDGVSISREIQVEQEQDQEYKVTSLLKKEIRGLVAW